MLDLSLVPPRALGTRWSAVAGSSAVNGPEHQWQTVASAITSAEIFRHSAPYPRCDALGLPGGSVFFLILACSWHGGHLRVRVTSRSNRTLCAPGLRAGELQAAQPWHWQNRRGTVSAAR